MFSLRRIQLLVAVGLACCLVIGIQCSPLARAPLPEIKKTLDGTEYTLKPLSDDVQGQNSATYRLVGGWKGKEDQPAIVKIIDAGNDNKKIENAKKEKEVLKKKGIKQLYHSEETETAAAGTTYMLVLKDIHTNYPQKGSPPLAPLYEILDENPALNVAESVEKVRALAITKAEDLAESAKIVYRDIQPLNVFVTKDLKQVYFIDYGFPSVEDVSVPLVATSRTKAAIKDLKEKALETMKGNAKNNYTVEKVEQKMRKQSSDSGNQDEDGKGKGKGSDEGTRGKQSTANA